MKLAHVLDGTGKAARDIQLDYFTHLDTNWRSCRIHGLAGPPGIGKSFIARTVQRTYNDVAIITTNNLLVDQYCETYPELVAIKGKDYYADEREYRMARKEALYSPCVFNPLSYYYFFLSNPHAVRPSTVVIDEAHKLGEMMLMTISKAFPLDTYSIPQDLDDEGFFYWLEDQVKKLGRFYHPDSPHQNKRRDFLSRRYEALILLYNYLKTNLHTVKIFYEMRETKPNKRRMHLVVQPLVMPADLLTTIFGPTTKILLMSGSLTEFHLEELFPKEKAIDFKNYEPLAPPENRPVDFKPLRNRKELAEMANTIRTIYENENRPNTIVHTSYRQAKELAPLLKDISVLVHDKETKYDVLDKFKKDGGILLACGMAEGVDLPGDACRLIIIPRLLFPNLGDQAVKKRLALPNGQLWYDLETIMTTVQQIGRGVRSATDSCTTYMLDPLFPKVIDKTRRYLTKGFLEAIQWQR